MSSNHVVKVRRDEIAACMTCPICNKLFRDATTISECLHTFCRKCIRKKLSQEELECCPICNIDLGCVPLEKLRPDHNLQDVRGKILPYKRRRVKAPEVVPLIRRKERSLSSLVVTAPRVSPQTQTKTTIMTMTGKRSKVTPRKKSRGSSFSIEKPPLLKKEQQDDSISMGDSTSNKITHNSKQQKNCRHDEKEGEAWDWKPLNDLVEAANRSKSSKLICQGSVVVKSEACSYSSIKSEGGGDVQRNPKGKDELQRGNKVEDDKDAATGEVVKAAPIPIIKLRRNRKKKSTTAEAEAVVDVVGSGSSREKRTYPIWFQLVPFQQQEGEPLRQIQGRYVKLNDGNVPVSIIQKLVMNKLELPSEHEVELRCMGERVVPTVQLRNLMELWVQAHPDIITAKIGSSAHRFLMEISYAKKPNPNPNPNPIPIPIPP